MTSCPCVCNLVVGVGIHESDMTELLMMVMIFSIQICWCMFGYGDAKHKNGNFYLQKMSNSIPTQARIKREGHDKKIIITDDSIAEI